MQSLQRNPAEAYRRVDLDARIDASNPGQLTRICLEEAVVALGQARSALEREPERVPRDALSRAHGIALWLVSNIAPDNPLRDQLAQFYGGLEVVIRRNLINARVAEIAQVQTDFNDLLEAAKQSQ
ncbi:MAG: hypothetical protein AAF494_09175 [Pseudomonadota bacterium]